MADRRVSTRELLELLDLTVPPSAIRIADFAIAVVFLDRVAVVMRRGRGWVAAAVRPSSCPKPRVDEHAFVDFDEALEVLESFWPGSDEHAEAFIADQARPDIDVWLERIGRYFAGHGYAAPSWRAHRRSSMADMLLEVVEGVTKALEAEREGGGDGE